MSVDQFITEFAPQEIIKYETPLRLVKDDALISCMGSETSPLKMGYRDKAKTTLRSRSPMTTANNQNCKGKQLNEMYSKGVKHFTRPKTTRVGDRTLNVIYNEESQVD